ncbi:MAG: flagellar biosynthesis protein FlhB [Planctomycetota bacterium]|nr:MAG: flagellar biosynthesis protein FlhB [Planctomycetota bacterium]
MGHGPEPTPRQAIGLRYDASESAPRVLAKGSGRIAERILEVAREAGVPIQEDPDLVEMLAASEVGDEIPVEVYGAVASLLVFLYRLNGEVGGEGRAVGSQAAR